MDDLYSNAPGLKVSTLEFFGANEIVPINERTRQCC
jgi:hypothetical protein